MGLLGEAPDADKEVRVLNRSVKFDEHGVSYEAGPRHVEMLVKAIRRGAPPLGVQYSPGVKPHDVDHGAVLEDDAALHLADPREGKPCEESPMTTVSKCRRVQFGKDIQVEVHNVGAHSVVYGQHPRTLVCVGHATVGARQMLKGDSPEADPVTGEKPRAMARRRGSAFPLARVQSIQRYSAEILSSTLKHGAKRGRDDPLEPSLVAVLQSDLPEELRQMLVRALMYGSPVELASAVRTPSARKTWQ